MLNLPPLIEKIRQILPPDQEIYLVGGAVRDLLLGRLSPDLDFAVPAQSIPLARHLAAALQGDFLVLDDERETARVILADVDGRRLFLDVATYRGADLDADLRGRDFTINAIACDLRGETILDPLGGAADLRAKRLRACTPTAFQQDPLRILRAVRLAAMLNFQIEPQTRLWMKESTALLNRVSAERLRDEFFKILAGPKPDLALRALDLLGVLPYFLPELPALKGVEQPPPHVYDVWTHTLAVLRHLDALLTACATVPDEEGGGDLFTGLFSLSLGRYRQQFSHHFSLRITPDRALRPLLFFAALYHDVAKPATRSLDENGRIRFWGHDEQGAQIVASRARAFHLSNDEVQRLKVIVRNHMRFHAFVSRMEGEQRSPARKAIYRFFRDSGEGGVDLILLGLADLRATYDTTLRQETWSAALRVARLLLENYWERPTEVVAPPRLLDGHVVMQELGIPPGPLVRLVLEAIREEQAAGKISSREEALQFARQWLDEYRQQHSEQAG
jgi:tRNA nucleotidyltransferase/poly(A) polymerase